jgi:MFS family permease
VINFINFSFSALLGPVFAGLLARASGGGERGLEHYQVSFQPLIWGVLLAVVLALLLRETGPAARRAAPNPNPNSNPDPHEEFLCRPSNSNPPHAKA